MGLKKLKIDEQNEGQLIILTLKSCKSKRITPFACKRIGTSATFFFCHWYLITTNLIVLYLDVMWEIDIK